MKLNGGYRRVSTVTHGLKNTKTKLGNSDSYCMSKTSLRDHKTDKDFGPLFSGELLRDEGIAKVIGNNNRWFELCATEAGRYLPPGSAFSATFTGEDIRFYLSQAVGCPQHPNAWGALINTLVRRKIIRPTGEYRAMKDSSSHARRTPVYTK